MSEWLSKYWFLVIGACVIVAATAYQLNHAGGKRESTPAIWRLRSLFFSLLVVALPVALFVASSYQPRHTELALQAVSCLLISLLFFVASWYSERIALFAFLCWLSTSSARPTSAVWTRVLGVLFLGAAINMYFLKA
jgi:hypothetical protein